MPIDVDGIMALSGDGLPHEILNGFAKRPDAMAALRVPIVPVPTGSANGFNLNLNGVKVSSVEGCLRGHILIAYCRSGQ